MLHVLFKGMEKMSKSKDEPATVGCVFMHGSKWRERRVPQHRLQDLRSLRKHLKGWEDPLVSNIIAKQS